MNGTGIMICSTNNKLTYQISSNRQTSYTVVDPLFSSTLLEDTSSSNALSGKTNLVSSMCSGRRGIFLSNGFSGLELGGLIDIEVNYLNNKVSYPAYRVTVSQSTSFVHIHTQAPRSCGIYCAHYDTSKRTKLCWYSAAVLFVITGTTFAAWCIFCHY
jgi:hypothetical protein